MTSDLTAPEFRRAYRHGRLLVLILALGTLAIFLRDAIRDLHSDGSHGFEGGWVLNVALGALLCWWFFRGGQISAGCVGALYGLVFICFWFASVFRVLNVFLPLGVSLHGLREWTDVATFLAVGGWSTFALWVIAFSKDVRVFREAQRLTVREREAAAFEWPPRNRR